MSRPRSPRAAVVALLALAACATSVPKLPAPSPPTAATSPPAREPVRAFLYDVEILQYAGRYGDLPELWLPEQGICCNASYGEANAFAWKSPRNHDREEMRSARSTLAS